MSEREKRATMDLQGPSPLRRWPGRRMRAGFVAALGAVAAVAVLWMLFSPRPPRYAGPSTEGLPNAAPPIGRPAPDFTLPLFSGGTLTLHNLRGKPVVLNFWASWCVPCREETPLLVRLHKIYEPRGVVFVGLDVEDRKTDAIAFINQYHVDYPVVLGSDDVMEAYQVQGIPTTVFIGADGVVKDKFAGAFTGSAGEKALMNRLDHLLRQAVSREESRPPMNPGSAKDATVDIAAPWRDVNNRGVSSLVEQPEGQQRYAGGRRDDV